MKKNLRLASYAVIALSLLACCIAALRPEIFGAGDDAQPALYQAEDAVAQFRLEREQLRAMQLSGLDEIIDDENSSADMISAAQTEKIEISRRAEAEQTIIGVLRARGYPDCCVAVSADSVNIMIRSQNINENQAAVIMELVLAETGVSAGDVRIIPIK